MRLRPPQAPNAPAGHLGALPGPRVALATVSLRQLPVRPALLLFLDRYISSGHICVYVGILQGHSLYVHVYM